MTRTEVLEKLADSFDEIKKKFPVASLSIFGSTARNEAGPDSDVDILVDFSGPIGLFGFCGLANRLEEILGCKVDLVTVNAIRPQWREHILKEAIRAA